MIAISEGQTMNQTMTDKSRLASKFTEIVALRLDVLSQSLQGIHPSDADLDRYKRRYLGIPESDSHQNSIELNTFKTGVDEFVCALMREVK